MTKTTHSHRVGRKSTHGHCVGRKSTSEYLAWQTMRNRCYCATHHKYKHYGARGIKVCSRWLKSFANFLADVGLKPGKEFSIDRIDVNGNYCPKNVRWSTAETQSRNRRNVRNLTFAGKTMCLSEWAAKIGIDHHVLSWRLEHWTLEKALSTPSPKKRKVA